MKSWPTHFDTARADSLGFPRDEGGFDRIIEDYVRDEGPNSNSKQNYRCAILLGSVRTISLVRAILPIRLLPSAHASLRGTSGRSSVGSASLAIPEVVQSSNALELRLLRVWIDDDRKYPSLRARNR